MATHRIDPFPVLTHLVYSYSYHLAVTLSFLLFFLFPLCVLPIIVPQEKNLMFSWHLDTISICTGSVARLRGPVELSIPWAAMRRPSSRAARRPRRRLSTSRRISSRRESVSFFYVSCARWCLWMITMLRSRWAMSGYYEYYSE
jgi:hypothetical protein